MSTTFRMKMVGAAGLSLLIAALPAAADSTGTRPEEYGNPPPVKTVEKSAKPVPKVKVVGTPGTAAAVKASQPPPKMPPLPPRDKDGRPIINMERSPHVMAPSDTARAKSVDSAKKVTKKPAR